MEGDANKERKRENERENEREGERARGREVVRGADTERCVVCEIGVRIVCVLIVAKIVCVREIVLSRRTRTMPWAHCVGPCGVGLGAGPCPRAAVAVPVPERHRARTAKV